MPATRKRQREEEDDTSANKRLKKEHFVEPIEVHTIMYKPALFKIDMVTVNKRAISCLHDVDTHSKIALCFFSTPDVMSPVSNDPCFEHHFNEEDVVDSLETVKRRLLRWVVRKLEKDKRRLLEKEKVRLQSIEKEKMRLRS